MVAAHYIFPWQSRMRESQKYCTSTLSCKLAAHDGFVAFIQWFNTHMKAIHLHLPTANYTKYIKGHYYTAIKVYNHLPNHIKSLLPNQVSFKYALKRFLCRHSFYSIMEYFEFKDDRWNMDSKINNEGKEETLLRLNTMVWCFLCLWFYVLYQWCLWIDNFDKDNLSSHIMWECKYVPGTTVIWLQIWLDVYDNIHILRFEYVTMQGINGNKDWFDLMRNYTSSVYTNTAHHLIKS
jgi:hypothetical protein